MKARFVLETIRFERGQDPKDAMNVGDPVVKMINKIDKVAKKFGFTKTNTIDKDKEEGVIIHQKWFNEDNTDATLYSSDDNDELWFAINDSGNFVNDPARYWTHDTTWGTFLSPEGNEWIDESVRFERGKEPKEAMGIGIESRLKNEDFVDDAVMGFDMKHGSAAQMYLPENLQIKLVRMILLQNYEFKVLDHILEDAEEEEDEYLGPNQIDYDISDEESEGWELLYLEHNYDVAQAIMYREL